MNGAKLFAASLVVFALTLGFFLGNICGKSDCCCNKAEMACCKKMEGPCPRQGMMPPPPPGPKGPHGHHGDFHKGPKFKGHMNPEVIDSLLQVTPEQKAALDANRAKGDSIFRDLRKQKHDAEKALGEALESDNAAAIDAAKAKVLEADKALLEHRINGVAALSKIFSKEQRKTLNQNNNAQTKQGREANKDRLRGPKAEER